MPDSHPLGRWLDTVTAANTQSGELAWLPRAMGGIGGQVATVAGREFAVIRPVGSGAQRQWNIRIKGFVWFPAAMPEGSAARVMGIKENSVSSFPAGHMSMVLAGKKRIPERVCRMLGYELRWVKSSNT